MGVDRRTVLGFALMFASKATGAEVAVGGQRPTYSDRAPSVPPNDDAIVRRFWVPGLDEGFVPQGLTQAGSRLLVAGYLPPDAEARRGPSRVYALDMETGAITGQFALPAEVGHADGLASDRANTLYLADGGAGLMAIDLAASLRSGKAWVIARRKLRRGPGVGTNFLAFDGARLWFGPFARDGEPRLLAARPQTLFAGDATPFTPDQAEASLAIPLRAQGAAFDGKGRLWLATSTVREGALYRLDAASGRVEARYAAVPGIEDLSVDSRGLVWACGEAGTRRWLTVPTFYPLVFAIDPARLR